MAARPIKLLRYYKSSRIKNFRLITTATRQSLTVRSAHAGVVVVIVDFQYRLRRRLCDSQLFFQCLFDSLCKGQNVAKSTGTP